ncbi:ferredoxin [Glycomyces scopariae]|uniref:Ferredoxin n=1 Tax=Glycomyces sambucus TaxID=380244 RepID=A0A1G9FDI9_9ACTN|nr:ferredoxin [Glycomyces sambucus]SDK86420.1 Ferredoxin [Glycomyces sambucus]
MQVRVDRAVCQVLAQCVFTAPDVFELDGDDALVYLAEPPEEFRDDVEQAARACPLQAIILE